MPTAAELERLEALVGQLTRLANIQRGDLIRAQDWNALVGALIQLARAVLAEEREGVVPAHGHPDQVTTGWLEPRLRALVERGPLAEPTGVARLIDLERRLGSVTGRIEDFNLNLQTMRDRVADVSTKDLSRQSEVTAVRRTVEGMSDARDEIRDLRTTLGSVQGSLQQALEASSRFTINGQLVDMEALNGRLQAVEALRDRLQTPTGDLLDARKLEIRLAKLINTFVTQEQLDEALKTRLVNLDPDQLKAIQDNVSTEMRSEIEESNTRLTEQIRAEVDDRLAGVNASVSGALSDALPGLQASLLGQVRPEISAAVAQSKTDLRGEMDKRLSETTGVLRQETDAKLSDLTLTLQATISKQVDERIAVRTRAIQADLDQVKVRLARDEEQLDQHETAIKQVNTKLDLTRVDLVAADAEQEKRLTAATDLRAQTQEQVLFESLAKLDGTLTDRINKVAEDLRASIAVEVGNIANRAVQANMPAISEQLRAQVISLVGASGGVTKDEVTQIVSDAIKRSISTSVPQLISREIEKLNTTLPDTIKTEVARQLGR